MASIDNLAIKRFVDGHINKIKPTYRSMNIAYWNATISGRAKDYKSAEQKELAYRKFFQSKENYRLLKKWNEAKISDKLLARQVKWLYLSHLENQIDKKLIHAIVKKSSLVVKLFSSFRATLDGKEVTDNVIRDMMGKELNSKKRQAVWEASKQVGEKVAKEVVALVKLRNRSARSLGYKNYYLMMLDMQEQDLPSLKKILGSLEIKTNGPFKRLKSKIDSELAKRYKIKAGDLMPWHYEDPFFQETPQIYAVDIDKYVKGRAVKTVVEKFYKGIGMETRDIIKRSDLFEKKGKQQHAYCTCIDRSGDIRIMANLRNDERWLGTMLHEMGHAVYDKYINKDVPFLLHTPAHTFTTEAVAMFFGRLSMNAQWLKGMYGLPASATKAVEKHGAKLLQAQMLIFARWDLVMFNFEQKLYENPDRDLNKLWWDTVEKFQMIHRPKGRKMPDWASKIHIATAPVYYHNYMLGELLASQFAWNVAKISGSRNFNFKYINNKKMGKFFIERVFTPGDTRPWNEMVKFATDEYLTPKYFVKQFVY